MSDLNKFKANDEARPLVLINPETGEDLVNDKKKSMTIWLVGQDSKRFREIASNLHDKARSRRQPTYEVSQARGLDLLAKCTEKFENLQLNGEDLKFSYDAAKDLYKEYPAIKDQVDSFIGDRTNFLAV